ncbi:Flp family type IVb pilin [Desulfoscipio geothermicus]|uniref:Pilus assembly protein Flp/PilA n=1 Tax=Desulfoscipio geothermicus DSM 3669 TaxID=1121426 RepID=A0A1I6D0Z6_9FIRM|nr:pilus assembly protein Flp/PilA [Desulfoscipio geothermicus DSM 3669]
MSLLAKLWKEESGQGMAEYGLILALVAVLCIAAFTGLSGKISSKLNEVGTQIENNGSSTPTQ